MYSRSDWNADATSNPLFYDMHDALTCPLSRNCGRRATSRNDNFTYNTRSELIQAELGTNHYAYSYDNIGNRKTVQELAEESTYEANQLNQYSTITQSQTSFTPTFDADGNQTLIKTSTGIWTVAYNADKRPTSFSQSQGDQSTIIECGYDYMGRRYTKKVISNGTVSLHQRYIYRGYLQIACVDLSRSEHPALWLITWDLTEPVATRPLAIQKNATWYTYSHDLTKNVTELYQSDGLIATTYDYSPYGAATAEGIDQPLQWSSEYHDAELALTYYNYRHYNPTDGRWINRDPIGEDGGFNLYGFIRNSPLFWVDKLGLDTVIIIGSPSLSRDAGRHDQNAWNFLNVGLRRAGNTLKKCWCKQAKKCNCIINIVIYKPGYDRRTAWSHNAKVENLTNTWLQRFKEAKQCINISYQNSSQGILGFLRKLPDDSIDQLDYLGHSTQGALFPEYGSFKGANDGTNDPQGLARSQDPMDDHDFITSLKDKFKETGEFNHMGCHGQQCAQEMNNQYNINANGASGKTDYVPAGGGGRPELEPKGIDTHYKKR